ncbi:MAG: ABC transporter ATP-binding protein/permease [Clostridia bacterium]|nr:ABC transporter ATP-binding protein/permease [Clostridia bacterium]
MLEVKNISKTYRTGSLTQRALDGVSLCLRDSEFVAILGQSGSGKTTLLNIIGGLDRYDDGDLVINGISTKEYKNRDWDTYRNHSVGFVFQSYNLIPHQTVLSNVELALTIGGVSKGERRKRALDALSKVGLTEHVRKKPSQLSGGQMQRVAIARALVNDPDILLADEPTGALDSDTSIQVMDLLKEVARDRLVVMVTHNPELADKYATRTVRLKDGKIVSDSDPYAPESAVGGERAKKRSGMSFLTALNLSLKNLWTKKVRTLLVSLAGSIGIIGIAMILSMSNGADTYIKNTQEETLKSYPLQITRTSFDLASLMSPADTSADAASGADGAEVREWRAMTALFSRVATNDLASLKEYIESGKSDIYDHVQAIEYDYNVTPQIYLETKDGIRQVNPDRTFAPLGISATDTMSSFMTGMSANEVFFALPEDPSLYKNAYDVKAGRFPEKYDECMLVLSKKGMISDLTLYAMGIKDPNDLDAMVKAFAEGYQIEVPDDERTYSYDEFLGIEFKLVAASDRFTYDEDFGVWADRSSDDDFMKKLVKDGETLKIVGVVIPSEDSASSMSNIGIAYHSSLTSHVMEVAASSKIVASQLESPDVDVITGKAFSDTSSDVGFDLFSIIDIDSDALSGIINFDSDALSSAFSSFDLSSFDLSSLDLSSFDFSDMAGLPSISIPELSDEDISSVVSNIKFKDDLSPLIASLNDVVNGFQEYSSKDPTTDASNLPASFSSYIFSSSAVNVIKEGFEKVISENGASFITADEMTKLIYDVMADFPEYAKAKLDEGADVATILPEYLDETETKNKILDTQSFIRGKLEKFIPSAEQIKNIASSLYTSYEEYAKDHTLASPSSVAASFIEYLGTDEVKDKLFGAALGMIDTSGVQSAVSELASKYSSSIEDALSGVISSAASRITEQITNYVASEISDAAARASSAIENALEFDPEKISSAFEFKLDPAELKDVMTSLLSTETRSFEGNLKKLGYASESDPSTVTIYPVDFEGKTTVKSIIEEYNNEMKERGEVDKVIVYTDLVDALMGSVTDIIDAISVILIAFVAISLVVSSVMIGVITYISVLERKKEIGILRAIGASRHNISNVFNAETFIIGALAGVLGIAVTSLLLIPANYLIHSISGQNNINAILPPVAAAALILLSIVLTLIGGIIPSRKAARSDPVAALRSE